MLVFRRTALLAGLCVAGLTNMAALCCRPDDDLNTPANYDALAQGPGYWEWQQNVTEGPTVTPATVGFSRQLTFGAGGQLSIRHDGQAYSMVAYQLSTGTLPRCGSPQTPVPLVTFVAEPQVPNNDRRTYSLSTTAAGLTLTLAGEAACVDGGYYETYVWHPE